MWVRAVTMAMVVSAVTAAALAFTTHKFKQTKQHCVCVRESLLSCLCMYRYSVAVLSKLKLSARGAPIRAQVTGYLENFMFTFIWLYFRLVSCAPPFCHLNFMHKVFGENASGPYHQLQNVRYCTLIYLDARNKNIYPENSSENEK